MSYVKLAQLHNLAGTSNKKKYELANQIDINSSLSVESLPEAIVKKNLIGYTPLHMSVMKFDLDLTLELLTLGASVLKQGKLDQWTPLQLLFFNTKIDDQMIWHASGILEEQRLGDTLLTAHVNTENPVNPVSQDGVSHLHIACVFNHVKAVQLLTRKKTVDQATSCASHWPGYTALHFAVRYSSVEAAKILMDNGANVYLKDASGMSSLQLMIDRLIDLTDSLTFGKPVNESKDLLLYKTKLEFEAEAVERMIVFVLKSDQADLVKSVDRTTFYAACVQKDLPILQNFLFRNIDTNLPIPNDSSFHPGWTPLHFAALTNVEATKLLLHHDADLNAKNTAGETPLDFLLKKHPPQTIYSILSSVEKLENVWFTDGSMRLLDAILLMNDCNEFETFLEVIADVDARVSPDSPIWPGDTFLHLAVRMNEIPTRIMRDSDDSFDISYSFDDNESDGKDQALAFWRRLQACLLTGCSLATKNRDGLSPVHLAFYLKKTVVVAQLMEDCKVDAVDPNGLSHLHVACALDLPWILVTIKDLCDGGADVNGRVLKAFEWYNDEDNNSDPSRVNAKSTPLHVAVIFKNEAAVEYLLEKGADMYARDSLGQTPIQLSMNSTRSIAQLFASSNLHVAAFANDDLAVRKLSRNGANIDALTVEGETPLHVAVKSNSDKAVRELIRVGAKIDVENPYRSYDTPLEYIARNLSSDCAEYFVIEMKRTAGGKVFSSGISTLHFACARFDHRWARQLLGMGANPNVRVCDDEDYDGPWKGFTPLHLLIDRARVRAEDTKYLPGMVELLMRHGADTTIGDGGGMVPVMMAFDALFEVFERKRDREDDGDSDERASWGSTVNMLYDSIKTYNTNPTTIDGFTLFHLACMKNQLYVVKEFLNNGVDVNLTTDPFGKYKGYTPLHVAFMASATEVARLLIECGANVTAEDVDGNTPLHFAARWSFMKDLTLIRILLGKGANVNAKNLIDQSPIDCHLKSKFLKIQLVRFLYQRGSVVTTSRLVSDKGSIGLAMKHAFLNDKRSIFDTLFEICDLQGAIADGFNAVHSIVSVRQNGEIGWTVYLNCIERMLGMGCEMDEQDEEGKTALHHAASYHNFKAVQALLSLGADINIVDDGKNTPFTLACHVARHPSTVQKNTIATLAYRMLVMNFLGLYVNDANQTAAKGITVIPADDLRRLEEALALELATMNSIRICESLALGDFMSESRTVAAYPRMPLWKRRIAECYLNYTAEIREAFPRLAGLLILQFRKALARRGLVERAKIVMHALWVRVLPDLCSEAIFKYLNNDELKQLLVEDPGDLSNPRKRPRLR